MAFRLLHSDALRDDPRNHTMPILEYIKFEEQIFAVMPRHVTIFHSAVGAYFPTR